MRWHKWAGEGGVALLMVSPALIGLFLFVALPFLLALLLSFTNLRLGSPLPTTFVGFEQYSRILTDPSFLHALRNNGVFAAVVVPVQTGLALALALALNQPLRSMVVFRTLFFMPVVFPFALVSVVWILIYAPGPNGLLNAMLDVFTLGHWQSRDFLHDSGLALAAIMMLSIWQGIGFQMVIFLAGLQAIPKVLYESAMVDGADRWQQFLFITIPQLRNTIIFIVLVTTILSFRLFDQVQIMTQGGPNDATTTVIFEAVRAAFERQQVARGAAMTVLFFIIVLLFTLLQRKLVRQEREME